MNNNLYQPDLSTSNNDKLPSNISEEEILNLAEKIITQRFVRSNFLTSPEVTKEFLKTILAQEQREHFLIIFLDNQNGVISHVTLFQGTIDGAAVYPREIVKAVLNQNAAAVILAHNHPSGCTEPSKADIQITQKIVTALNTIEVRVLDHLIIGGAETVSFAEQGLI